MAENRVLIEGIYPTGSTLPVSGSLTTIPSGTQTVSGTVSSISIKDPAISGIYVFSITNAPGVVAANNFLSLFNPIGSGKNLSLAGVFISSVAGGGTAITDSLRGFRITTATVGTLQADSAVCKFMTVNPDPVAEVRTGNPTVTLGPAFFNSPPVISATVGTTVVHTITVPPDGAPFLMVPGEGIVLRTAAGDTDQQWNLSVIWAEV